MNRTFTVAAAALAIILVGCNAAEAQPPVASTVAMPSPVAVAPSRPTTPDATLEPSPSPVDHCLGIPNAHSNSNPSADSVHCPVAQVVAKVAGATKVKYFTVKGESPAALLDDVVLRSKASCKSADTLACVFESAQHPLDEQDPVWPRAPARSWRRR